MLKTIINFFKFSHTHTYYRQRVIDNTASGVRRSERVVCKGCGHVLDQSESYGRVEGHTLFIHDHQNGHFRENKLMDFQVQELIKYKNEQKSSIN